MMLGAASFMDSDSCLINSRPIQLPAVDCTYNPSRNCATNSYFRIPLLPAEGETLEEIENTIHPAKADRSEGWVDWTERATEQKTHPESRDRPNRKTSKNRAVQGSCAHKFVQKSGSIIGRFEPKFSLSPYSLRCFGGASLIRWLDDFWCFFELVFIALPL